MDKHLTAFKHLVANRYEEYNTLFLQLPFSGVPEAGRELPKFSEYCQHGLANNLTPEQIVTRYFESQSDEYMFQTLFLFLQFVERQIVLFDALEDNAFGLINDVDIQLHPIEHFQTRLVLTAHPTQFYPPPVINIIEDLTSAIKAEDIGSIKKLLLQMGKTSFSSDQQPTPLDEAKFLMTYLQRVFYPTLQDIQNNYHETLIELGFWPGADRDGNPNVTANITLEVAKTLKENLLKCYQADLTKIKRRMTFPNALEPINRMIDHLDQYQDSSELLDDLNVLKQIVINQHDGLFIEVLEPLIAAVQCFGFHFASLDIRQDSTEHESFIADYLDGYTQLNSSEKITLINQALKTDSPEINRQNDVIAAIQTIPIIQQHNGERGCHRYIISNTHGAHHVLEILLLLRWAGIEDPQVDIVPLFESIDDLQTANEIMRTLYQSELYQQHLRRRNQQQTIMLGFSDGTKDGGYITANWSIYQAKKRLSAIAKEYDIDVVFFDGRGGPPARGGGNTHRYYRAQEPDIALSQIQLTVQGQTISTNFGTTMAAKYNLVQLYNAGKKSGRKMMNEEQVSLLDTLSEISGKKYTALKNHHQFLDYLEHATPLKLYGELNIASRPPRRGQTKKLSLNDLRAIPFVGSWSQMKQNVPGYYGVGTALHTLGEQGQLEALQSLYQDSLFFSTLIDNASQSLKKSYFPLTQYLADKPEYSELWHNLASEAKLTEQMILQITEENELLEHNPVTKLSIEMRANIVLPLLVIQQYALIGLAKGTNEQNDILQKLILKSMATNINAARNSA